MIQRLIIVDGDFQEDLAGACEMSFCACNVSVPHTNRLADPVLVQTGYGRLFDVTFPWRLFSEPLLSSHCFLDFASSEYRYELVGSDDDKFIDPCLTVLVDSILDNVPFCRLNNDLVRSPSHSISIPPRFELAEIIVI
jgi:hypothetical protein